MKVADNVLHAELELKKQLKLLEKNNWDKDLLNELVEMMGDASICGLGQAAGNPIKCAIKYFGNDLK